MDHRQSLARGSSENRRSKLERTDSPQSVACYPSVTPDDLTGTVAPSTSESPNYGVRFSRSVIVRFTRSHRDYTPRQIKDCFYQYYELQDIKEKCFDDLRRHMFGEENDDTKNKESDDTYCLRGLENFDEWSNKQKHKLRAEAALKVFDAEDDGCDEITISREYASVTARSQTWANIMGLRDQRDAFSIHGQSR